MILFLNSYAFFGFDRLMESVGPTTTVEGSTREFVDDLYDAAVDEVILVAVKEFLRTKGLAELVHVVRRDRVVEIRDAEQTLDLLNAFFGRHDGLLLFIHLVVDVATERTHDGGELVVQLGDVSRRPGNNQRRARFVDQDRVDLVDNRVVVAALDHVFTSPRHVVAKVVKTEFRVGAVGHVALVRLALLLEIGQVGTDAPDRKTQEAVQLTHPVRVARGEVVIHRHHVHAVASEGVQVHGQGRHERLTFARLHFCDPAKVKGHATHQLLVVMALAEHARRALTHHRERLEKEVVEGLAVGNAFAELLGLGP